MRIFRTFSVAFFYLLTFKTSGQNIKSVIYTHVFPNNFTFNDESIDSSVIYSYAYKNMHLFRVIEPSKSVVITSNGQKETDTSLVINFIGIKDSLRGILFSSDSNNDNYNILKNNAFRSKSSDIDNIMNLKLKHILDSSPHSKIDSSFYDDFSLKKEVYRVWEDKADMNWFSTWIFEYSRSTISTDFLIAIDFEIPLKYMIEKVTIISPKKWLPDKKIWFNVGTYSFKIETNKKIDHRILKIFNHFENELKKL